MYFRFLLCIEHCDIMEEFCSFAKKTWGELSGGGWWRTVNTAVRQGSLGIHQMGAGTQEACCPPRLSPGEVPLGQTLWTCQKPPFRQAACPLVSQLVGGAGSLGWERGGRLGGPAG